MSPRRPSDVFVRRLLLPMIVVASLAPSLAAEPARLSESEFLRRLERADPRFESIRARLGVSRAEVKRARARPNPSLSYDREVVFSGGNVLPDRFIRLSWPLDVSGQRSRLIAAAETGLRATEQETSFELFSLVIEGLDAYHDAAYARLRVALLHTERDALARAAEAVRARQKAGDAAGYDRDRLEIELAAHDDLIADAESDLAAARLVLARLVGEPRAQFDASDPLDLPVSPAGRDALLASSLSGRADHRAALLRAEQADAEGSAAGRAWIPDLVLTGGLKTTDSGVDTATGYIAGISLSLPFLDHGQADRAHAEASGRRWRMTARAIESEITTTVYVAYELLTRRAEQARKYRDALARAADLVRRAEVAYREGDRPIFELLDAYRTAREVRLRELELRREAKRAELNLWRALGRRP